MRITVGRSGGLVAAPGLTIQATVDLTDGHARVTEAASNYSHDLSAADVQKLRSQIDTACFFKLPADIRPPSTADQYHDDSFGRWTPTFDNNVRHHDGQAGTTLPGAWKIPGMGDRRVRQNHALPNETGLVH